uniref:RH1 domain-containing protein n=1 Tax=Panagrolaimus sp. PS1159 TaxID=55785 RepID=A0AC35FLT0_9BILA
MSTSGISSPSASPSRILSKDIFDVCKPIKEQLEVMQVKYGEESIFNLTAPILAALEELERYKSLYEEEQERANEYQISAERLERQLKQKHDEKMKLQQDMTVLEATNQEELINAYDAIQNLKNENKRLKQRIDSAVEIANEAIPEQCASSPSEEEAQVMIDLRKRASSPSEEEAQVMIDLRKRYAKEHEQVKELQEQISLDKQQITELKRNLEKLLSQNKELLRKNKSLVSQGKMIIQEKCDLSKKLDHLNGEYIRTRNALKETSITCKDLEAESYDSRFAGDDVPKFTERELQDVFMSKVRLMERVTELEMQLERFEIIHSGAY